MSKHILNREGKLTLIQALSDGFFFDSDIDKLKGIDTIIPDKPMSRKGFEELLKKLKSEDYDQEIIDNSICK